MLSTSTKLEQELESGVERWDSVFDATILM